MEFAFGAADRGKNFVQEYINKKIKNVKKTRPIKSGIRFAFGIE